MANQQNNPFFNHAKDLMLGHTWQVKNRSFHFTEIEFYSKSVDGGGDPYTHGHAEQQKSNTWYFHGSGIDITFGDEHTYGGILIRGIKYYDKEGKAHYVSGPIRVATEIFSAIGQTGIQQLNFGLKKLDKPLEGTVYSCPRVGLNPKLNADYANKHYRFVMDICPEHKFAQKELVAKALLESKQLSAKEINPLFRYKIIKE
ncbi:MAG: hypothetical protein C0424_05030 [Sphingobacteriaceae bacterium]|nr:hypothetical protein [Sphingobacteriaceae bacterium]